MEDQTPATPKNRGGRPRLREKGSIDLHIFIPPALMEKLEIYCALECRTKPQACKYLLTKALEDYTDLTKQH